MKGGESMSDMVVVGSKVKAYIKGQGCHTSGDALNGLNEKVQEMLAAACMRAKANKRSTVKPQDL